MWRYATQNRSFPSFLGENHGRRPLAVRLFDHASLQFLVHIFVGDTPNFRSLPVWNLMWSGYLRLQVDFVFGSCDSPQLTEPNIGAFCKHLPSFVFKFLVHHFRETQFLLPIFDGLALGTTVLDLPIFKFAESPSTKVNLSECPFTAVHPAINSLVFFEYFSTKFSDGYKPWGAPIVIFKHLETSWWPFSRTSVHSNGLLVDCSLTMLSTIATPF